MKKPTANGVANKLLLLSQRSCVEQKLNVLRKQTNKQKSETKIFYYYSIILFREKNQGMLLRVSVNNKGIIELILL